MGYVSFREGNSPEKFWPSISWGFYGGIGVESPYIALVQHAAIFKFLRFYGHPTKLFAQP